MKKKIITTVWAFFFGIWGSILFLFLLIWNGVIGYMPPIEQLQNPIDKYASLLISSDGKTIGTYARSGSNRIYTAYEEISPLMIQALIATEDVRFESHSGIDFRSFLRAVVKRGILRQESGGGGSTITQQLAKQLYSPDADNVIERLFQKPIEWIIAVRLERSYTKQEIIAMYLNQFDFLYNAVGIRSAAQTYYSKSPKDLTLQESAMLVGMCKNPSLYNPILHSDSDRPIGRRNVVLDQMRKAGYISQKLMQEAQASPLDLHFKLIKHTEGLAPYFRENLRLMLTAKRPERSNYPDWNQTQYQIDSLAWENNPVYGWCAKNTKSDGSHYDLYADGLKIYTTLNSKMQAYAERAVREHVGEYLQPLFERELQSAPLSPYTGNITQAERTKAIERSIRQSDRWFSLKHYGLSDKEIRASFDVKQKMQLWSWNGTKEAFITPKDSILYYKRILRAGFMAMNPSNGNVLAYVGGVDFKTFMYDMVSVGRRQVGSTIKPFLYSLAMLQGLTPCDMVMHSPVTMYINGKPWTPRNASAKRVGEMVTIKWGLQNSSNWVTANLMSRTSPHTFVSLLRSYGIAGHLDPVVSLALGTPDVSLSEMVSAYSAFVEQGIRVDPLPITRIEDQYGNVIASFSPKMTEVLPADVALKMLDMLKSVVDGGTGSRLRFRHQLNMPLGGKTGTTQENSDGWFVGFTPQIVAAAWVGGEDRAIHFRSMAYGQGASSALPIFGKFMKWVYDDPSLGYSISEQFHIPSGFYPCGQWAEPDPSSQDSGNDLGDNIPLESTYSEDDEEILE